MNFTQARKWRKRLGHAGESAAAALLTNAGCQLLIRNCKTPRAEIDLVARDGLTLVFVEVKTRWRRRNTAAEPRPGKNLTDRQRRRIYRGAFAYLRELGNPPLRFRFDVVEVVFGATGLFSIRHHRNAFGRETLHRKRTEIR